MLPIILFHFLLIAEVRIFMEPISDQVSRYIQKASEETIRQYAYQEYDHMLIQVDQQFIQRLVSHGKISMTSEELMSEIDDPPSDYVFPDNLYIIYFWDIDLDECWVCKPCPEVEKLLKSMFIISLRRDKEHYQVELADRRPLFELLKDYMYMNKVFPPSIYEVIEREWQEDDLYWANEYVLRRLNLYSDFLGLNYVCGEGDGYNCGIIDCAANIAWVSNNTCMFYAATATCKICNLRLFPFRTERLKPWEQNIERERLREGEDIAWRGSILYGEEDDE